MSRDASSSLALPVLAAGVLGGVAGSLFCLCWIASLPAGAFAVRWAARLRGGALGGGLAFSIGAATGILLGAVTASLGTALFLSSLDPAQMAEAAELTEAMLGERSDMSRAGLAMGHAFVAFTANFFLGIFGGLLGAATLPAAAEASSSRSVAPSQPALRFEPPPGWTPEPSPAPQDPAVAVVEAGPPQEATSQEAPLPPEDSATLEPEVPRGSVPPEAFSSAWHSTAVGGTPRPAAKQSPPPEDGLDDEEPEEPTLDSGTPPPKDDEG